MKDLQQSYNHLEFSQDKLDLRKLYAAAQQADTQFSLHADTRGQVEECRRYLDEKIARHEGRLYGINTGFGSLANIEINQSQLEQLQENLLLSHACGSGTVMTDVQARLLMILKIKSLSLGHSGVRAEVIDRLLWMLNNAWVPEIFMDGSLGASGDLAPLAHACLPLIGRGRVRKMGSPDYISGAEMWETAGMQPLSLAAKEGLALLNGTQFMLALAVEALVQAEWIVQAGQLACAMSLLAFDCRPDAFLNQLHQSRGQRGQCFIAAHISVLLEGPRFATPRAQTQDQYAFRCAAQVAGASLDALRYVKDIVSREANAVTDNPLIFPELDRIVSGGNFHGQPLALALDFYKIALAELGSISERRTYNLLSGQRGLPEFLVAEPGLNSGLMIPQYTAAALVSRNKQLCTPASVDSITSSNGQEDHVSMGANAAYAAGQVVNNVWRVIAIEWLTACQAMHFRDDEWLSEELAPIYHAYRREAPPILQDDYMKAEIDRAEAFLRAYCAHLSASWLP